MPNNRQQMTSSWFLFFGLNLTAIRSSKPFFLNAASNAEILIWTTNTTNSMNKSTLNNREAAVWLLPLISLLLWHDLKQVLCTGVCSIYLCYYTIYYNVLWISLSNLFIFCFSSLCLTISWNPCCVLLCCTLCAPVKAAVTLVWKVP